MRINGSRGWERTGVGVVTGVALDPRERTLICSRFTVPVTDAAEICSLGGKSHCQSPSLTAPVLSQEPTSRGR